MNKILKQLALDREKRTSNNSKYTIPLKNIKKMTITELVKREELYRVYIDKIIEEIKKNSLIAIIISPLPILFYWECDICTYSQNLSQRCEICNTYHQKSINRFINDKSIHKYYLFGNDLKLEECHDDLKSSKIPLIGVVYRQSQSFPERNNIIELLNTTDNSEIILLTFYKNQLEAYKLYHKLFKWKIHIQNKQSKKNYIQLDRKIEVSEKNKWNEVNLVDIRLFCYPIKISQ